MTARIQDTTDLRAAAGFSVLEVLIAIALFVIIAASAIVAVLGSFGTTRLAEEETQAALLAAEGLEAVQSIRNQGFANLTNGPHGLSNTGGTWVFSGISDASGKFTRVVTVADVQRDGAGNIVASGGSVDADTKKVTAAVTWNVRPTQMNTVDASTYLADWQTGKPPGAASPPPTETCSSHCVSLGFAGGVCRASPTKCAKNEVYTSSGDAFCTGGPQADTCCCKK